MPRLANRYCPGCRRRVAAEYAGVSHLPQFFMTVITLGLWLPLWAFSAMLGGSWRCRQCGGKAYRSRLWAPSLASYLAAVVLYGGAAFWFIVLRK